MATAICEIAGECERGGELLAIAEVPNMLEHMRSAADGDEVRIKVVEAMSTLAAKGGHGAVLFPRGEILSEIVRIGRTARSE